MSNLGIPEFIFVFLAVSAVALFSFLAVASWADSRRRERESYYRSETLKKIAESGAGGATALEILREDDRISSRKRRDGLRLGGLINIAVGVGLMVFLRQLTGDNSIYMVGLIPLFIGFALLLHSVLSKV